MRCERTINRYMELDKYQRVPLLVTLHLLICRSCRTTIRRMTHAEALIADPLRSVQSLPDEMIDRSLEQIIASGLAYPHISPREYPVSMKKWVIVGCALIAGFMFVPLSSVSIWSRDSLGQSYAVALYLLYGLVVTAYCGLFVGTNIDFFVKKFGLHRTVEDLQKL